MGSGKDVRAGGGYVEFFVKNEELDRGLAQSNQKIRSSVSMAKSALTSAGASVGAAALVGYGAITRIGKGVASAVGSTAAKVTTLVKGQKTGLDSTALALQRLTPVTTKVWDVTQGGIGRATRMLGTMRSLLEATGAAGKPLLAAFDGLAKKGAGIAWSARAGSLIRGDFAGASVANHALKAGREAFLQDRMRGFGGNIVRGIAGVPRAFMREGGGWRGLGQSTLDAGKGIAKPLGQLGSWANIRVGYAATAALNGGLKLTGKLLQGIGNSSGVTKLAKSLLTIPFRAVSSGFGLLSRDATTSTSKLNLAAAALGRLKSAATGAFGALRSGSGSLGRISAGILGPMAAIGALHAGGISELFTAKGFAQHASEISDRAKKSGNSVEYQSALEAASKLSGISIEETTIDKDDNAQTRADKKAKRAQLEGHMKQAVGLGAVVTTDQAKSAKEGTTALAAMSIALRSVGTAIGSAVLPQITAGVQWITRLAIGVSGFIQKNPQLVQQMFTVGKAIGVAAAVMGALTTAFAVVSSPIGMVAVGVAAAASAFTLFGGEAQGVIDWLGDGFAQLQTDFDDTFGGIVDALAAGNLALAAEVAWAGLRMVFSRGWQTLNSGWLDFKNATLGIFDDMQTNLRIKLDQMFPGFELAWSETVGFLGDVWVGFVANFMNAWEGSYKILVKGINYLRYLFSRAFDLKGANDALDKKYEQRAKQRGLATDKTLEERNEARAKRAKDLAERGTMAVLDDEKDARAKQRAEEAAAAREADALAVETAKTNLNAVRKRASRERAEKENKIGELVAAGAAEAKSGGKEAHHKGFEAHDVRSQAGLSLIAQATRGRTDPTLNALNKQLGLMKTNNDFQLKNWQQLIALNTNLAIPAVPIG